MRPSDPLPSQWYHMPIVTAARQLGVSMTVLKQECRLLGLKRWPYRKVKGLARLEERARKLAGPGLAHKLQELETLRSAVVRT